VDSVEVTTVVYLPAEEVYEFLLSFENYANYSEYLTEVRTYGDGSPGTEYELDFSWWKLGYTARSEVTGVDPPNRVDWRIVEDIDAVGSWRIDGLEDDPPETQVTLSVEYSPGSADGDALNLPRFVSLGWVVEKVKPKIRSEAERVVRRIVADLEGEPRDVKLDVETT
jgi:uncharacterized membrane protein